MNIASIVTEYSAKITDEKIFFFPNIPKKKLRNAIDAYAPDVNAAEALILVDNTVFGGAKDGMLISSFKTYLSNMFEEAKSLELSKLKSVTADYGTLTTKIGFNGGS